MPRLKRDTPSVFDVDDRSSTADEDNSSAEDAVAPETEIGPITTPDPEGTPSTVQAAVGTPTAAARGDARKPRPAIERPADDADLQEWRKYAERKAGRHVEKAIKYLGDVLQGTRKAEPARVAAAEKILELRAGKNPSAAPPDRGRPAIKIFSGAVTTDGKPVMRPGGANILPADYEAEKVDDRSSTEVSP